MTGTDLAQRVQDIITPTIEALGYDVVRVLLLGGGDPRLQIMAEPFDGREMNVDDCADISRAASKTRSAMRILLRSARRVLIGRWCV